MRFNQFKIFQYVICLIMVNVMYMESFGHQT